MSNGIMSETDLIVLGAGPGGLAAAMEAAMSGMRVVLINGSHLLGYGLHGTYKSKSLWELAKDLQVIHKLGKDFASYVRVDFERLYEQLSRGVEELSAIVLAQLSRMGITFVPGFARFIDPHRVQVDGQTFTGRTILIATGTRPRHLPEVAVDGYRILTSDHVVDLRGRRRHPEHPGVREAVHVSVHDTDPQAVSRHRGREVDGDRGLADAALA